MNEAIHSTVNVRGTEMKLMTYNRSLELCARMNYETENLDFIDKILPGEILYDLGACEGRFSIYAALKGAKVISFEPEKENYSVFVQNIELNGLKNNITSINAGVGARTGESVMNIGQPWAGGHQKVVVHEEVRSDLGFDFVDSQKINIISLDSFLAEGSYEPPHHLKIDIDGSEIPFLKGAERTLQSDELRSIIFELNEKDSHYDEIINILAGYGFTEDARFMVPNEPHLYNIVFSKK